MKDYSTIIQSVVTEKASRAQERGVYTFIVKRDATKIDVKNAIKMLYGVEVKSVQTMVMPKKTRMLRYRHIWAKRPVMKKAIVKLKGDKTIDPNKLTFKSKK